MAFTLRLVVVCESAAIVPDFMVVEVLDLAALKRRLVPQVGRGTDFVDCVQCIDQRLVHGLTGDFVTLADQRGVGAGEQAVVTPAEIGRETDRFGAVAMLLLAIE